MVSGYEIGRPVKLLFEALPVFDDFDELRSVEQ